VLYGINRPTPTGDELKNPRRTPLDTFRDAIQDGLCVDMRYASDSRDEVTERTIQPVRISNVADLIYVEGWTLGSTDTALKRYRIDRVVGCKISDEEPSGLERIDVEPREPRPTSGMQLRVAIAAGNAWLLDEHVFHDVLHNEDGSVSASMYVGDSHDYAVRWGLQYAGFATILEPATVAEDVRQQAREALAMYAEGVTAGNR